MSAINQNNDFQGVSSAEHCERAQQKRVRRRVLKSGLICFNAKHSTLPCAVRDISDNGAKLTVGNAVGVPDTFELYIELDGTWVFCEVVWRRGDVVGVRYTSPPKTQSPKRKQVITGVEAPTKVSLRRNAANPSASSPGRVR